MKSLARLHADVALDARVIANARIRALFTDLPSTVQDHAGVERSRPSALADSDLARRYIDARSEGREFASILGAQWTPLQWMRGRPGFTFEINTFDFAMMGQSALDPAIDEAATSAVMDAISSNPGFIGALVRDVLTRKSVNPLYTVEDR